ncbi:MAG: tRNA glutamyl-Q(34) synthetase GluQRS [Xanthomonadales bacterium]|nr:tRNA glutamyl-Q(34) synthetase GluQRS [Xanthomonadales bacterium]
MKAYRGRFAPSPTGDLHFGSLVSAVASHAAARAADGIWLVRIEDLDPPREVAGSADRILSQLAAYGMTSDEPVLYQSQRQEAYAQALQDLLDRKEAFHCGCTRRDLPATGVYPGTCANGLPSGKKPRSVRLRVSQAPITFDDRAQGAMTESLGETSGPFVIRRADSYFAYQLAVVVDDAFQGITEVVRGCDLLDSTARQIHLQRLLGLAPIHYLHHPIVLGPDGRKLSKQWSAQAIDSSDPLPALLAAWRFLGQVEPPGNARRTVDAFWNWAGTAWDLERLPAARELSLSA